MKSKHKTKEYNNGELTIVWKPEICIHAAKCIEMLPTVYNPTGKPWITIENATSEELKEQIDTCPSGALSYYMNAEMNKLETMKETQVEIMKNGPLVITGKLKITDANGNLEFKTKKTAFCRCGGSANKPYCDGTHSKIGFQG